MVGRGVAAVGDPHTGLLEEFREGPHLGFAALDRLRADADFCQYDERHDEQGGLFENFNDLRHPCAEVDEAVGIDEDPHFQSSGFVWSCSSSAACHALVETSGVWAIIWRRVR